MSRVLPESLDFTTQDFDAWKDRLSNSAISVFPLWTDFSRANFGVILSEMISYIGDVTAFYQNNQARESNLVTATQRRNGVRHARRIGFTFRRAEPATAPLQITLASPALRDVPIAEGLIARTQSATDPLRFQIVTPITISQGAQTGSVTVENSETFPEFRESDNLPDQRIELPNTPFLEIVSVADASGQPWAEKENLLDSSGSDRHFTVRIDDDSVGLVIFGDDRNGAIPDGLITVIYKVGGGEIQAEVGSIRIPEFVLNDIDGNPVVFEITNTADASGGAPEESLAEAQAFAPRTVTVNERSVNDADYETNAERILSVARSLMVTSDQVPGIAENTGQLYIVARGATTANGRIASAVPTQALLDEVRALILTDFPPTITFVFQVLPFIPRQIDHFVRVKLRQGADPAVVDKAIRDGYADFYAATLTEAEGFLPNPDIDFGVKFKDENGDPDPVLAWSDMFAVSQRVAGVLRVDEDSFQPPDSIVLALTEFPTLGDITIINELTGLPLV